MEYRYRDEETLHTVRVTERGSEEFEVCVGERVARVRVRAVDATTLDVWIDGVYQRVRHAGQGEARWVAAGGGTWEATRQRQRRQRWDQGRTEGTLAATMPGQVVAVLVGPGDAVTRGQALVVMEAMKMELKVAAPHDGTISRVLVQAGEAVERGQTLVEMG